MAYVTKGLPLRCTCTCTGTTPSSVRQVSTGASRAALALVAVVLLGACGGTSTSTTSSAAAPSAPPTSGRQHHAIGDAFDATLPGDAGGLQVQVTGTDKLRPVLDNGAVYVYLRLTASADGSSYSADDFYLVTSDGAHVTKYEGPHTLAVPTPPLPHDQYGLDARHPLNQGEVAQGWLGFPAADDRGTIVYAPFGTPQADWTLSPPS